MCIQRICGGLFLGILLCGLQLNAQTSIETPLPKLILFKGDSVTAYRDPMVYFHKGICYLFCTLTEIEKDGKIFMYTAFSKSKDLIVWSPMHKITPRDQQLDYSSPGNIIYFKNQWVLCLQTYPRPDYTVNENPRYGNENARLFIMRSHDMEHWSKPEMLQVKGDNIEEKDMGRMIDPFLLADQNEKGKWWIFFKQKGASRSYSYDLKHWKYEGHIPAGENICIVPQDDGYVMLHSPDNGIGIKRSKDLVQWVDELPLITLGQKDWSWAKGRITAGFLVDRKLTDIGNLLKPYRYLLFFHGSGPATEQAGDFDRNASLGIAWSNDLKNWNWH